MIIVKRKIREKYSNQIKINKTTSLSPQKDQIKIIIIKLWERDISSLTNIILKTLSLLFKKKNKIY